MYLLAMEFLEGHGYGQYEISNWAANADSRCRHNLQYWRNLDYLGFGAGAHGHYNQMRWENQKTIINYIQLTAKGSFSDECISPAGVNQIYLSNEDCMSETMMMGMRLTEEGVGADRFLSRFGVSLDLTYTNEIKKLIDQGLVEWAEIEGDKHLRLTKNGRLLGNQVFMQFIKD
jgi:oxygen-independent coproporphyrinogen-3 oxidase